MLVILCSRCFIQLFSCLLFSFSIISVCWFLIIIFWISSDVSYSHYRKKNNGFSLYYHTKNHVLSPYYRNKNGDYFAYFHVCFDIEIHEQIFYHNFWTYVVILFLDILFYRSLSLSVYVCVRYFLKNTAVYISTSRNDLYMYICICIITQGIVWWTTFPMRGCGKSSFFSNYFCLLILSMFVICLYAVITCEKYCTFSLKLLFFILWLLLLGIYLFLLAIF